jgi:hypothetical protein
MGYKTLIIKDFKSFIMSDIGRLMAGKPTKAISVRPPAWWQILHAGKDIENRSRPTDYRGRIYIHAPMYWPKDETEEMAGLGLANAQLQRMYDLGGHVVGTVEIVDCVQKSKSKWHEPGMWGYVLRNPQKLRQPFRLKGQLGIFDVHAQGLQP